MVVYDKAGQLLILVEKTCKESHFYSHSAYGHFLDTAEKAESLARKVGADPKICWIAGLLHDIGAVKKGPKDHHETGAEIAGEILTDLGYLEDIVRAVQYCILVHRGSVNRERETIEARVVASADAMSHFFRVSELLVAAHQSLGKNPKEAQEWVREKLKRSWNKLMPEARTIARAAYDAAQKQLT